VRTAPSAAPGRPSERPRVWSRPSSPSARRSPSAARWAASTSNGHRAIQLRGRRLRRVERPARPAQRPAFPPRLGRAPAPRGCAAVGSPAAVRARQDDHLHEVDQPRAPRLRTTACSG